MFPNHSDGRGCTANFGYLNFPAAIQDLIYTSQACSLIVMFLILLAASSHKRLLGKSQQWIASNYFVVISNNKLFFATQFLHAHLSFFHRVCYLNCFRSLSHCPLLCVCNAWLNEVIDLLNFKI